MFTSDRFGEMRQEQIIILYDSSVGNSKKKSTDISRNFSLDSFPYFYSTAVAYSWNPSSAPKIKLNIFPLCFFSNSIIRSYRVKLFF